MSNQRRGYGNLPKDPFELVKARIVSSDERQVIGIQGGGGVKWPKFKLFPERV